MLVRKFLIHCYHWTPLVILLHLQILITGKASSANMLHQKTNKSSNAQCIIPLISDTNNYCVLDIQAYNWYAGCIYNCSKENFDNFGEINIHNLCIDEFKAFWNIKDQRYFCNSKENTIQKKQKFQLRSERKTLLR